jgi:hypothetical protein
MTKNWKPYALSAAFGAAGGLITVVGRHVIDKFITPENFSDVAAADLTDFNSLMRLVVMIGAARGTLWLNQRYNNTPVEPMDTLTCFMGGFTGGYAMLNYAMNGRLIP